MELRREGKLGKTFRRLSGEIQSPPVARRLFHDEGNRREITQSFDQVVSKLESTFQTVPQDIMESVGNFKEALQRSIEINEDSTSDDIVAFFIRITKPKTDSSSKQIEEWLKKMKNWEKTRNTEEALLKLFTHFSTQDQKEFFFVFIETLPESIDLSKMNTKIKEDFVKEIGKYVELHYGKSASTYETDPFKMNIAQSLDLKRNYKTLGNLLWIIERFVPASSTSDKGGKELVDTITTTQKWFSMGSFDRRENKDNIFRPIFNEAFRSEDGKERLPWNATCCEVFPYWMSKASLEEKQECLEMLNNVVSTTFNCEEFSSFKPTNHLTFMYQKYLAYKGNQLEAHTNLVLKEFLAGVAHYLTPLLGKLENDERYKEINHKGKELALYTISSLEYYGITNLHMFCDVIQNPKKLADLDPKKYQPNLGTPPSSTKVQSKDQANEARDSSNSVLEETLKGLGTFIDSLGE